MKKILIFLTITISLVFIISISYFFFRKENTSTIDNNIYTTFNNNYKFSENKLSSNIKNSFTNVDDKNYADNISEFFKIVNRLDLDLSKISNDYNSYIKNNDLAVFKINYEESFKLETINSQDINDLISDSKNLINYEYALENLEYEYSEEESIQTNKDYLYRLYYKPIFDNKKILNLGSYIVTDVKDEQVINANLLNISPKLITSEKLEVKDFYSIDQIRNNKDFVYYIEYINNDNNIWVYSKDELGINNDSLIKIKSFEIEYIYIEEESVLVPVIRLNGVIQTQKQDIKISFWSWILE